MVRLILLLSAVLLFPLMIKSQGTILVEPLTFVLHGNPSQADIHFDVRVTNTSNEDININWAKRMRNEPSAWADYICDKTACWDTTFNSNPINKPNELAPGEFFNVQVHVMPFQKLGTGDYELNLVDVQGNILTTVTGTVIIDESTSVKENNYAKLSVFPNPTSDYFEVTETPGLRYVEVYNIVGNKVRTFDAVPQKQYYVGDLTDGIYLVRMTSSSSKVLKTIRLSKR